MNVPCPKCFKMTEKYRVHEHKRDFYLECECGWTSQVFKGMCVLIEHYHNVTPEPPVYEDEY